MLNADKSYTTLRLAPLGIHYGLVHAAVLIGKNGLARLLTYPLLELGDASMQWYLGLMHHTGTGAEKDLAAARRLYATSAAQGFRMGEDGLLMLTASEREAYVDTALLNVAASKNIYSNINKLKCSTRDTAGGGPVQAPCGLSVAWSRRALSWRRPSRRTSTLRRHFGSH